MPLTSKDVTNLSMIFFFYALVAFVIFPALGYLLLKSKAGITYGFLLGSVLNIFLWFQFGQKMIR